MRRAVWYGKITYAPIAFLSAAWYTGFDDRLNEIVKRGSAVRSNSSFKIRSAKENIHMKKTAIAMLLILVLLVSLAACGGKSASSSSGLKEIEVITMPELDSGKLEVPDFNGKEITTIPFSADTTVVLQMPEFSGKEITYEGVNLTIPVIDYEISFDKIGSAYSSNYTVPDIQIDVPDFDDPALKEAFVSFADNLTPEDQTKLSDLDGAELAEVMSVQLSVKDLLFAAFEDAGITLAIDPITGSVPIDASLLFDTNAYALKSEGKAALKAFFTVYETVISRPEFNGVVDAIIIEGHTDTQGSHESNQLLSEQRAQAVVDFLLSDECGLTQRDYLKGLLKTVGRSYDDPVYAADGTVDMAASRRVEIHFALHLE